jgi:hypothetical protein
MKVQSFKNTSNPIRIELTIQEAKSILHSLSRTMCKGNELTVSMELEDKLLDIIE